MIHLFSSATADGDSPTFITRGKIITVHSWGEYDGATVTIYMSTAGKNDDAAATDSQLEFTANGISSVVIAAGITVWANISSAGSSTNLNVTVAGQND